EVTAQIGAAARVSAREEIFLDGEMLEAVPALHHLDHSALDELRRVEPVDPLAPEFDVSLRDFATLGTEKVRDCLQRRRLAGAIRPEQGDDLDFGDRERHSLQDEDDVVVDDLDVADREVRGRYSFRNGGHEKGEARAPPRFLRCALLFLGAIARRDLVFLRVLRRRGFHHGPNDRLVGRNPVRYRLPLLAVPLLELDRRATLVVHARNLERRHQADRTQLLQALLVDVQVLERPAHLLAGNRLALAEPILRLADSFGRDDAGDDAARMVDRTDARLVV